MYSVIAFESAVNVPLTGVQTVNGVTTGDGFTVCLGAQTAAEENGYWIPSSTTAWVRPVWYASGSTQLPGQIAATWPGGTNGLKFVVMTETASIVVDTDPQTWVLMTPTPPTINTYPDYTDAPIMSAVFSLTHTPDMSQFSLYIDGVKQKDSSDYYSVSGSTATLNLVGSGGKIDLANITAGVEFNYSY